MSLVVLFSSSAFAQTFAPPASLVATTHSDPADIAVGDIDGDGLDDLAWSGDAAVDLLFGPPTAVTSAPLDAATAQLWTGLADIDGDGFADLFLERVDGWWELRGSASGLEPQVFVSSHGNATYAFHALGDVDGDGIGDVSLAWSLQLGSPEGPVEAPVPDPNGGLLNTLPSGDANGDGYADLALEYGVASEFYGGDAGILELHEGGVAGIAAAADWTWQGTGAPKEVLPLDVDADGDPELFVADELDPHETVEGRLVLLDDIGSGAPTERAVSAEWDGYDAFEPTLAPLGDIDGDGLGDLAVSFDKVIHRVGVDGSAIAFEAGDWRSDDDLAVGSVSTGDLDGDGVLDLASWWMMTFGDDAVAVWTTAGVAGPGTGTTGTPGMTTGSDGTPPPTVEDTGAAPDGDSPGGESTGSGGCGCDGAGGGPWWLAGMAVATRRRRR